MPKKTEKVRKMAKKNLKNAPLHPLRVKLWGQKHIGSSYFCELSLHTEFQSPSTYPSGRAEKVTKMAQKTLKTPPAPPKGQVLGSKTHWIILFL